MNGFQEIASWLRPQAMMGLSRCCHKYLLNVLKLLSHVARYWRWQECNECLIVMLTSLLGCSLRLFSKFPFLRHLCYCFLKRWVTISHFKWVRRSPIELSWELGQLITLAFRVKMVTSLQRRTGKSPGTRSESMTRSTMCRRPTQRWTQPLLRWKKSTKPWPRYKFFQEPPTWLMFSSS